MQTTAWLIMIGIAAGLGYWFWNWRSRWLERERASEERFATFVAEAKPATLKPVEKDTAGVSQQRLLLDAAAKAGEAGEPVLSIQLYARLIARYPDSAFAAQARAAVEAQKKKLAKT